MRDYFDDYGNTEHRGKVVARKLAEYGISLDDPLSKLPGETMGRADGPMPPFDTADRDGFIDVGERWLISPAFAAMVHYQPPALHNSDHPEGGKNEGDPEGYEGMIHG